VPVGASVEITGGRIPGATYYKEIKFTVQVPKKCKIIDWKHK
jgi:hypothetical protein